ncbi:hypothetical protein [Amycolatopsis sulphurea]|uniref:hypothetical protein n=1 Tax=Amycolatopsis sulphurea TaxID=76022 RepID=UPI000BF4EB78|nr:hypothetical protein [Amycolatopsis sulphurea]
MVFFGAAVAVADTLDVFAGTLLDFVCVVGVVVGTVGSEVGATLVAAGEPGGADGFGATGVPPHPAIINPAARIIPHNRTFTMLRPRPPRLQG